MLQEQGLAAALRAHLQGVEPRAGVVAEFACEGDQRLAPEEEHELYRLAQAALNNVLQHAHAPGMRERVERLGGRFSIDSSPGAGTRVVVEVPG